MVSSELESLCVLLEVAALVARSHVPHRIPAQDRSDEEAGPPWEPVGLIPWANGASEPAHMEVVGSLGTAGNFGGLDAGVLFNKVYVLLAMSDDTLWRNPAFLTG